jgi:preprotein translocase subunit SecA
MMRFSALFPDLAAAETRIIRPIGLAGLPSREFGLIELYCNEPHCDCRRVLLSVVDGTTKQKVATINYGFEPPEPPFEDEGQIFLDPINPQTGLSASFLELISDLLERDADYRERLERHYTMWKAVVDDPSHPDHRKVRSQAHDDPSFRPAFPRREPARRDGPKVGPNDPCPCGSGKKHKKCCRP